MPNYRIHILFYLAIIILLITVVNLLEISLELNVLVYGAPIGLLYSLLPDIDARRSVIRSIFVKILSLTSITSFLLFIIYQNLFQFILLLLSLSLLVSLNFLKHRGIFHSPLLAIVLSIPLYFVNPLFCVFAFIGYFSHLVIDAI